MADSTLTEEQRQFVEQYREQLETQLTLETSELIQYCKLKSKVAAHYKQKAKQVRETNEQMRQRVASGNVGEGMTEDVVEEMIRVGTEVHERRMSRLAAHFKSTWGEPMDDYLSKGGGSGCAVLVAVILGATLASGTLVLLL